MRYRPMSVGDRVEYVILEQDETQHREAALAGFAANDEGEAEEGQPPHQVAQRAKTEDKAEPPAAPCEAPPADPGVVLLEQPRQQADYDSATAQALTKRTAPPQYPQFAPPTPPATDTHEFPLYNDGGPHPAVYASPRNYGHICQRGWIEREKAVEEEAVLAEPEAVGAEEHVFDTVLAPYVCDDDSGGEGSGSSRASSSCLVLPPALPLPSAVREHLQGTKAVNAASHPSFLEVVDGAACLPSPRRRAAITDPPAVHPLGVLQLSAPVPRAASQRLGRRVILPYGRTFSSLSRVLPHQSPLYLCVDVELGERRFFELLQEFQRDEAVARCALLARCTASRDRLAARLVPLHKDILRCVRRQKKDTRRRARAMAELKQTCYDPHMGMLAREAHAQCMGLNAVRMQWAEELGVPS